ARIESIETRGALRAVRNGAEITVWPARTRKAEQQLRTRALALARAKVFYEFPRASIAQISGLLAIGFAPASDLLLAVSVDGLTVFDACGGERVLHDRTERELAEYPEHAEGVGPIEGVRVALMGLDGGIPLPRRTRDGFRLGALSPERDAIVWLTPPEEDVE